LVSQLEGALVFMKDFGIFDIVLPFLLVFTVVFGILEKTKIFGIEGDHTRKNLNSMVAFVIGFFVVAASQVVDIIQTALPIVVIFLIFIIAFMVLYGSTMSEEDGKGIDIWNNLDKHKGKFAWGIIIALVAVILGAMDMLEDVMNWIFENVGGPGLSAVVLLLVIGIFMWFVVKEKKTNGSESG